MYINNNGALVSESKSINEFKEENTDNIRVPHLHSVWTFEPIESGLIKMTYILNSDPGGNIPDWLVNLAIDEGPVQTIKRFLDLLKTNKYQSEKLVSDEW